MMDFIMIPSILGIIALGFYKVMELIICRRERLQIIEKMGERFTPDLLDRKNIITSTTSFSALKYGCLLVGLGLGLLVAFFIIYAMEDYVNNNTNMKEIVYGSCTLLFGGFGLLTAFVIELKHCKNNKN